MTPEQMFNLFIQETRNATAQYHQQMTALEKRMTTQHQEQMTALK